MVAYFEAQTLEQVRSVKGSNSKENILQDKLPVVIGITKAPSNESTPASPESAPQSLSTNV